MLFRSAPVAPGQPHCHHLGIPDGLHLDVTAFMLRDKKPPPWTDPHPTQGHLSGAPDPALKSLANSAIFPRPPIPAALAMIRPAHFRSPLSELQVSPLTPDHEFLGSSPGCPICTMPQQQIRASSGEECLYIGYIAYFPNPWPSKVY